MLAPWKKSYDQPRQHIKKQRHYFANKGPSSQSYGFSNSHVWMCELDYKKSWALKNWCSWTVVLQKTLESPLDYKKIQLGSPKGNQSWIFIGRTDAEAETPILWAPDGKNWLIWKDHDVGEDWRQEDKRTTEDEMVGWYHQLDGLEFEQALGVVDGQGGLVCCGSWGCTVGHDGGTELTDGSHMAGGFFTAWATREAHVPCYLLLIHTFAHSFNHQKIFLWGSVAMLGQSTEAKRPWSPFLWPYCLPTEPFPECCIVGIIQCMQAFQLSFFCLVTCI